MKERVPIYDMIAMAKDQMKPMQYRMNDDTLILVVPFPRKETTSIS